MKSVDKSNFKPPTIPYLLTQVERRGGETFQVKNLEDDGSRDSLENREEMGIGNGVDRVETTSI